MIWTLNDDAQAVAGRACSRIQQAARTAIATRGRFSIVLAGGTTPALCYRLVAQSTSDWDRWHVYFGDERCLAVTDPRRNSAMASEALLDRVSIPRDQIHPIAAELGTEIAARDYAIKISGATPFDMVLLGLGEDGHTASLFPGRNYQLQLPVIPVHDAPKPPAERVSMNFPALSNSRQVLFLVSGDSKQKAVERWRSGDPLPASRIRSRGRLEVLVDRAAWGECPP